MKLRDSFPAGVRNLLFDIGNVLVDLDLPAALTAFEQLRIGGLRPEELHPHQTGCFLDYELGLIDDKGFAGEIRRRYDCHGIADHQLFEAWNAMLKDPLPGRFETVEKLRKNYRLFVLSNTNPQHIDHIRRRFRALCEGAEFDSLFERCFYSHTLHLRKPDPEIYRRVIAEAGIVPEETLFIDDNACNLPGAEIAGLKTHHLCDGKNLSDLFE